MDSSQVIEAENIARLCPYVYGTAVPQARAMLRALGFDEDYTSPCEMGYQNGQAKTGGLPPDALDPALEGHVTEGELILYPNPADDVVYMDFNKGARREIVLLDITGRILSAHVSAQARFELNVANLASGIYLVRVIEAGNKLLSKRIIIAR